jgi:ADP-heptose:LPS heptosyltransferase
MRSDFAELVFTRDPPVCVRSLDCHEIGRFFSTTGTLDARVEDILRSYAFIYSWLGADDQHFRTNLQSRYTGELRVFPFRPPSLTVHIADYYLSSFSEGCPVPVTPAIPLLPQALAWRRRFWSEHGLAGERVLALAPGSGARSKNWPLSFFQAVAQWWKERTGGKVLVLWGPAEEDRMMEPVHWEECHVFRGLNLGRLTALQAACDLYLGNDSGTSHLAAALGVPTVVVFGPTDPAQWRPRGKHVWIVSENLACSPCGLSASRSCGHRRCLTELGSHRVAGILEGILSEGLLDKVQRQL